MNNPIDKKKIIAALEKQIRMDCSSPMIATTRLGALLWDINQGEFDAKPKEIRILPACPGSTRIQSYDMTTIDGKLAYLIDITDILLGFQNTHVEKYHKGDHDLELEYAGKLIEKWSKPK